MMKGSLEQLALHTPPRLANTLCSTLQGCKEREGALWDEKHKNVHSKERTTYSYSLLQWCRLNVFVYVQKSFMFHIHKTYFYLYFDFLHRKSVIYLTYDFGNHWPSIDAQL